MALLQVTENSLRAQVPESVFAKALALADHGHVTGLSADGARLSATVDDIVVTVRFLRNGLEAAGACGEIAPCAHAVAAALAWVRTGDHGHDDWYRDEWYPNTESLGEVLDELEDLIEESPDTAREILERAVDLLEEVFETNNVYGGELLDDLGRVEGMHLAACLAGSPDPVRLAEWLIGKVLTSSWCGFERSLGDYAPALGDQGLARCHELLVSPNIRQHLDYKLSTVRESLARAEGGTDAVVTLLAQQASSGHDITKIARVLIADGRDDDALLWIGRGLQDYRPVDPSLLQLALECHERAGREDLALQTRWRMFTLSPGFQTYLALTKQAESDKAAWSAQAIAHLRAESRLAHVLTDVLLHEGDMSGAWEIFGTSGRTFGHDLRMRVVNARAVTHPQDAIPIYRELAEINVSRASRPGYQEAIQHLRVVRTLSERAGTTEDFTAYLARLRAAHPGKKVFHQALDRAGLPE